MANLSRFVHQSHGPLMLDHTNQRFLKGPWSSCGLIEPWNLLSTPFQKFSPVESVWSEETAIKEALKKKLQINWEPRKQQMYSHNMNLFTYMIHVLFSNIVFLHKRLYSYGTRFSTWWFQPMWKKCSSNWILLLQGSGWKYKTLKPPPRNIRSSPKKLISD